MQIQTKQEHTEVTMIRLFDLINEVENIITSCQCTMHTIIDIGNLSTTPQATVLIQGCDLNQVKFATYLVNKLMLEAEYLNIILDKQYNAYNDINNLLQGDMLYNSYTLL